MSFDTAGTGAKGRAGYEAAPRSVTAFFDTKEAAETARRDLVQAGVPDGDIHLAGGEPSGPDASLLPHPHGFWTALKDFFMPEEDRFMYAEGLRRGGFTVAVRTDEAAYDTVLDILDRDGAIDMDEREASWRGEGWAGQAEAPAYAPAGAGTAGFGASEADHFPLADRNTLIASSAVSQSAPLVGRTTDTQINEPDSAYAPEIDKLNPGSTGSAPWPGPAEPSGAVRDLAHGRSRVRSYVSGAPALVDGKPL